MFSMQGKLDYAKGKKGVCERGRERNNIYQQQCEETNIDKQDGK